MSAHSVMQNQARTAVARLKKIPPFRLIEIATLGVVIPPAIRARPGNYQAWANLLVTLPAGAMVTIKNKQYLRYSRTVETDWGYRYFCQFLNLIKLSYASKKVDNEYHFTIIKNPWFGANIHAVHLIPLLVSASYTSRYRVRLAKMLAKLLSDDSRASLIVRLIMDAKCSSTEEVEQELAKAASALQEQMGLDLSKLHNLSIARTWKRGRKPKAITIENDTDKSNDNK